MDIVGILIAFAIAAGRLPANFKALALAAIERNGGESSSDAYKGMPFHTVHFKDDDDLVLPGVRCNSNASVLAWLSYDNPASDFLGPTRDGWEGAGMVRLLSQILPVSGILFIS